MKLIYDPNDRNFLWAFGVVDFIRLGDGVWRPTVNTPEELDSLKQLVRRKIFKEAAGTKLPIYPV